MGDPRFQRKKYKTPRHPWEGLRIKEENELIREFGLRNKKEIWKSEAILNKWREQAKRIMSMPAEEKEKEQKILLGTIRKLGILDEQADLDSVLTLTVRDILERRLQTVIYKLALARTPRQARQFIVHRKITVNGTKIDSPSAMIKLADKVRFIPGFSLKFVKKKEDIPKEIEEHPKEEVAENA